MTNLSEDMRKRTTLLPQPPYQQHHATTTTQIARSQTRHTFLIFCCCWLLVVVVVTKPLGSRTLNSWWIAVSFLFIFLLLSVWALFLLRCAAPVIHPPPLPQSHRHTQRVKHVQVTHFFLRLSPTCSKRETYFAFSSSRASPQRWEKRAEIASTANPVRSVRCCWCIMDLSVGGTLFDLFFFLYDFRIFFCVCYLTCVPLGDEFKVLDRFCVTSNFSSHFF